MPKEWKLKVIHMCVCWTTSAKSVRDAFCTKVQEKSSHSKSQPGLNIFATFSQNHCVSQRSVSFTCMPYEVNTYITRARSSTVCGQEGNHSAFLFQNSPIASSEYDQYTFRSWDLKIDDLLWDPSNHGFSPPSGNQPFVPPTATSKIR